jgi:hypothetical protein
VFNMSDAHHFRRVVAGACMVMAPLFFLASAIVSPKLDTHEARQLAYIAQHPDRWYLSEILGLVAIALAVPAVLGLMHMLRERHATEGHVGGGLALIGLLAFFGATAIGMVAWQMTAAGADSAQMASLLHRVNHTTGTMIPFTYAAFGLGAGFVVLAYGLMQARAVHWSMAFCLAVGAVLANVGFATASITLAIVAAAFLVVGFGSTGRMVLNETDEEWEHTPEFHGFRPVGAH